MDSENRKLMGGLTVMVATRDAAASSILLFLPVYLFRLGGILMVVVWEALTRLMDVVLTPKLSQMSCRMGWVKSIFWGQMLWTVALMFITMATSSVWWLVPAMMLVPIAAAWYWIPFHLIFSSTNVGKFGQDLGALSIVGRWACVAGPVFGGLIAYNFGLTAVFVVMAVLMVIAGFLGLFISSRKSLCDDWDLHRFWEKFTGKWFRDDLPAFMGVGIQDSLYAFFWPVFLLANLKGSELNLGGYKSVVLLFTTLLVYFMGKRIDHGGVRKIMTVASLVMAVLWIIRSRASDPLILMGVDIADGWMGVMLFLPFSVYSYRRAVISNKTLYIAERETAIRIGAFVTAIYAGVCYALGWGWQGMGLLGVVGVLLMNLLPKMGPKQMAAALAAGE